MSNVKVKKSVLQSIIKKHLFESPAPDSGVSRRITVGPDKSPLPKGLPLSPTDRMSVQLDTERPPVDDPDYIPENSRELGYAVQTLSEMVPADLVEKAYLEFKKVLERLEEEQDGEESENVDLLRKFESVYRKNRIVNLLVREAADDFDDEEDEAELARLERELGSELKLQADIELARPRATDSSLAKLDDAFRALGIKNRNLVDYLVRQIRNNSDAEDPSEISGLTMQEFNEFFDLMLKNMSDKGVMKAFEKAQRDSDSHRSTDAWDVMVRFIQDFPRFIADREKELLAHKRDPNAIKQSEYQTIAKPFGYAAASGIRQAFIRDVMAVRALSAFVVSRPAAAYVNNSIKEAFEDALSPANQERLDDLFDQKGLEEYRGILNNPEELKHSDLFKNFSGLITYEALASVAELNFKPHRGKPGRPIGSAFMTEFGNENLKLQPHEEMQLRSMADRGLKSDYVQFVEEILEKSEEDLHFGLLTAAATMTAEDADKDEFGSYTSPAFSTMKKAASVSKPPEAHVADYLGKEDPLVDKIKAAGKSARKAAKQAGRNK